MVNGIDFNKLVMSIVKIYMRNKRIWYQIKLDEYDEDLLEIIRTIKFEKDYK